MSPADHRAFTATKQIQKPDPHGHRVARERACSANAGAGHTRPEQKVRRRARILTAGELDFVFRL